MPSFVNFDEGLILKTVNLTKIKDFPAREYLARKLGGNVRVVLDNDSHTGALAEHRRGAGRGYRHMLYCPVSTGVSSGIIIDDKLFRGSYGWAGESGHMIVTPGQGIECGCGNKGCLMSWNSGSMIAKHVHNWIEDGEYTIMTTLTDDPGKINSVHIEEAWLKNDAMAVKAVEQIVNYMAVWIYNLYVTLNINCFVFGGGLLKMNVRLLERVREVLDGYNQNDMPVYFKTAELGDNIGIIGAAELIFPS
jgi:glucokinase